LLRAFAACSDPTDPRLAGNVAEGVQAAHLVVGQDDEVHPGHRLWLGWWSEVPAGPNGVAQLLRLPSQAELGSGESGLKRVTECLQPRIPREFAVPVVEANVIVEMRFNGVAPEGGIGLDPHGEQLRHKRRLVEHARAPLHEIAAAT
jgi:hypothetical protein